jgi:glycosyltransferase involved in cell wall biosynthesis
MAGLIFKVSVIIPVYNAEKYLRKAVESALQLKQTGEVILVEDHSPDNSLVVCKELQQQYENVRILTHQNKANLGAGGARNLGIINAQFNYVAFLDADDYYLPNRFEAEEEIFPSDSSVDGVYGYTKGFFENETVKQKYLTRHSADDTFSEVVGANELLYALLFGGKGRFHTNAITLRKEVFEKAGYFDTELKLTQDTELWARLAAKCKLVAGNIVTPISVRTVHDQNRIHNDDAALNKYSAIAFTKLVIWATAQKEFEFSKINHFFTAYYLFVNRRSSSPAFALLTLALRYPNLFLSGFFYRKLFQVVKGD